MYCNYKQTYDCYVESSICLPKITFFRVVFIFLLFKTVIKL